MDPSWAMEDLHMFCLHQLYQHLSCDQRCDDCDDLNVSFRGRRTGRDAAYEDLPRHRNQAAAFGNSWRAAKCLFRVLLVVALVVMVVVAVGASLMF